MTERPTWWDSAWEARAKRGEELLARLSPIAAALEVELRYTRFNGPATVEVFLNDGENPDGKIYAERGGRFTLDWAPASGGFPRRFEEVTWDRLVPALQQSVERERLR